jgi:hypothetical protein
MDTGDRVLRRRMEVMKGGGGSFETKFSGGYLTWDIKIGRGMKFGDGNFEIEHKDDKRWS